MTLPPPRFVSQWRRSAPGPVLSLASDLTVPLAEVRLLVPASGAPDRGVPCRVDLALVTRERVDCDPPAATAAERPGVGAAVLVRPCLHTPVDMEALRRAFSAWLAGGAAEPLDEVLLPRPEGRSLRVPERLPAGWADRRPPGLHRRTGVARLQEVLVEHPGWLERAVHGPRARGRPLAEGWPRASVVGHAGAQGATASPPSLAGELALLLPDGNTERRGPRRRGEAAAAGPRFALGLVGRAWAGGDGRPELERAAQDWAGASARWQAQVAGELRERTRVGLRDLWRRTDGRRTRHRAVQPALVELLGTALRPVPAALLWVGGGGRSEAALIGTAELLWSALWSPWLVETLGVALGGRLGAARWLWGDGSLEGFVRAVQGGGFSVAQVVVPVGHGLHRRAVGALELEAPRGRQRDWRGRWGCPERRRKQAAARARRPVTAVLAGPARSPGAVVQALWGAHDWPVAFGARLGVGADP